MLRHIQRYGYKLFFDVKDTTFLSNPQQIAQRIITKTKCDFILPRTGFDDYNYSAVKTFTPIILTTTKTVR